MVNSKELFKMECNFISGATCVEAIPNMRVAEVAFAGRSNVGKSSLLNTLTKRKSLTRTSKTPGCTRQLNFFSLGEKIMLVDLPGYGYAKASKQDVAGWNELIRNYLAGRANLRQVFQLIDSRHGVKKNDIEIMNLLDKSAVSYQIVLTKTDKQSKAGIEKIIAEIEQMAENHPAMHPDILTTSSVNADGIDELRSKVAEFAL